MAIDALTSFLVLVMMPPVSVWFQFISQGDLSRSVAGFVIKLLCSLSGHLKLSSKASPTLLATIALVFSVIGIASSILDDVVAGAITADQRITSFESHIGMIADPWL